MNKKHFPAQNEFSDLGFGLKVSSQKRRLINKDGSFNVERRGLPFFQSLSFYHSLVEMTWLKFNCVVVLSYFVINFLFASIYTLIGINHLGGITGTTFWGQFLDAYFFSGQTITTVGYGVIHPIGFWASTVSLIESMTGLLGFALATGLLYGRFSRPNAKILYSKRAVIAPYRGITAFEFRIANARKNQLIDVDTVVILSMKVTEREQIVRRFFELPLERKVINFFPLTWTIVHPINEDSPMYRITFDELKKAGAEFLILIKAFDDTFSQSVHSRSSYTIDELVWGAKFKNIYIDSQNGITAVDMRIFNEIESIQL
ncbi:MAG: ion channel [Ignavibacteriaceae bacterium]|jgi:inward rectifier potassium channel